MVHYMCLPNGYEKMGKWRLTSGWNGMGYPIFIHTQYTYSNFTVVFGNWTRAGVIYRSSKRDFHLHKFWVVPGDDVKVWCYLWPLDFQIYGVCLVKCRLNSGFGGWHCSRHRPDRWGSSQARFVCGESPRSSEGAKRSEGYNHWTTGLDWQKMMFIFPMDPLFGTLWGICFFPLKQIQVGLTIWGSQQSTSGDGDTNAFWEAKPPLSPWVRRHFATRLWFLWWRIQDMGMKSLQSGPIWCFTRTGTSWMHCKLPEICHVQYVQLVQLFLVKK